MSKEKVSIENKMPDCGYELEAHTSSRKKNKKLDLNIKNNKQND